MTTQGLNSVDLSLRMLMLNLSATDTSRSTDFFVYRKQHFFSPGWNCVKGVTKLPVPH